MASLIRIRLNKSDILHNALYSRTSLILYASSRSGDRKIRSGVRTAPAVSPHCLFREADRGKHGRSSEASFGRRRRGRWVPRCRCCRLRASDRRVRGIAAVLSAPDCL